MRWEISTEQADFRAVFAEWLAELCTREARRGWLDTGDHEPFARRLVADGWFGVGSPEELGGEGGGLVELALAAEELGRVAAPASEWLGSMVALPLLAGLPDAAKALLADGVITVFASPAGAVPDGPAAVTSVGGRLTGAIATVLGADRGARLVVPVDGGAVLVAVDQPGVTVTRRMLTDRSRSVADVVLDGAEGAALGGTDTGTVALRAAVLVAADALGVLERMLDDTVAYVGQRRQFGVPIGSFQAVKHAAAEMLVTVEAARSIVYFAAASVDSGHPDAPLHAAAAKAQVCAAAAEAADTALVLHGAIGYTWEHDLQVFYKRAKLDAELFGPPRVWNERLARCLDLVPQPERTP